MAANTPLPPSPWFVAFPDTDAVADHAARARVLATQQIAHASGRPWLLGNWAPGSVTTATRGPNRLAVCGEHAVTALEAERAAAAASPRQLDLFADRWPGSHHVIASLGGEVVVRGTVSGVRSVFHAGVRQSGGGRIASDRADILAALVDARLDEKRLAIQLLSPGTLHPFTEQTVWRDVDVLPGDHRLVLDHAGRAHTSRRWTPPDDALPLAEGARYVREALTEALAVRIGGHDLISADLGGVDSTAVVCTAARAGAKLVTYTAALHDVLGDDVDYARRTVEALGNVEHHVVPASTVPLTFDGVDALDDILDTPSMYAVNRHRRMYIVEQAAKRGSALHLSGMGGDELFGGAPARVHQLFPRHPRTAWRNARGFTAKYRWSRRQALRQLADRRPYAAWLRQVSRDLTSPQPPLSVPMFTWNTPPRLPPWVTPGAVDAVREAIGEQAATTPPLGDGHGAHRELVGMHSVSRFARHVQQMSMPLGIVFTAPYYDDRMIETALAVRSEERVTPWRYKPLIAEATRGVVPDVSRGRTTKAHATLEEETGLRRHRASLLALCEDSRLARLGLVDPEVLRQWCLRPLPADLESALLHPTVGCEVWLRSREGPPVASPAASGR
ncbi:asparagine synthase-related protein [Streptomyces sp. NPDC003006]